jgi:hypothetical protein
MPSRGKGGARTWPWNRLNGQISPIEGPTGRLSRVRRESIECEIIGSCRVIVRAKSFD